MYEYAIIHNGIIKEIRKYKRLLQDDEIKKIDGLPMVRPVERVRIGTLEPDEEWGEYSQIFDDKVVITETPALKPVELRIKEARDVMYTYHPGLLNVAAELGRLHYSELSPAGKATVDGYEAAVAAKKTLEDSQGENEQ